MQINTVFHAWGQSEFVKVLWLGGKAAEASLNSTYFINAWIYLHSLDFW